MEGRWKGKGGQKRVERRANESRKSRAEEKNAERNVEEREWRGK